MLKEFETLLVRCFTLPCSLKRLAIMLRLPSLLALIPVRGATCS